MNRDRTSCRIGEKHAGPSCYFSPQQPEQLEPQNSVFSMCSGSCLKTSWFWPGWSADSTWFNVNLKEPWDGTRRGRDGLNLTWLVDVVNNQLSPALELYTGVPQGSILGPLLFSLYINDLPSACPDVETQLYADDTVMYVHARTKQLAAAKLTSALEQISKWLNHSCLQLNQKKKM